MPSVSDELLTKAMYMYKISMDKHARANNGKVNYLNQHSVLWGVQKQKSHNIRFQSRLGVCAGLAITWLRATLKNEDFMKLLHTARSEVMSRGKDTAFTQKTDDLFVKVDEAHPEQNDVVGAFKNLGRLVKNVEISHPYSTADRHFEKGNFYYVSTNSHAMALICHGDTVDFYDPNVGVVTGVKKKMVGAYIKDCVEAGFTLQKMNLSGVKEKMFQIRGFAPL